MAKEKRKKRGNILLEFKTLIPFIQKIVSGNWHWQMSEVLTYIYLVSIVSHLCYSLMSIKISTNIHVENNLTCQWQVGYRHKNLAKINESILWDLIGSVQSARKIIVYFIICKFCVIIYSNSTIYIKLMYVYAYFFQGASFYAFPGTPLGRWDTGSESGQE